MDWHSNRYLNKIREQSRMLQKWNSIVCNFLSLAYCINIMHFRFIHIINYMSDSFHFYDCWAALQWIEISVCFLWFPNHETFVLFLLWVIMNQVAISTITNRLFSEHKFSLEQSSVRGTARSYGKRILNFIRYWQTGQCGYTILLSNQQCMRILVVLRIVQLLYFHFFFT